MFRSLSSIFFGAMVTVSPAMAGPADELTQPILRERSVLVWDGAGGVKNKILRLWDDQPALQRDFEWIPTDPDAPGSFDKGLTGEGRLTWSLPSNSGATRGPNHSVFIGTLESGRPNGHGLLVLSNGVRYKGTFRAGRFHGEGELRYADGAVYRGDFANGLPEGTGAFVPPGGEPTISIFSRGIAAGGPDLSARDLDALPEGVTVLGGRVTNEDGLVSVRPVQAAQGVVDLRVYLDEGRYGPDENGFGTLGFEQSRAGGLLRISRAYYDIDHQINSLDILDGDAQLERKDGMFGEFGVQPVHLVLDAVNRGGRTVQIERAFLAVERSMPDLQPFLIVTDMTFDGCVWPMNFNSLDNRINIDNYGKGRVLDAKFEFTFSSAPGEAKSRAVTLSLGEFNDFQTVSNLKLFEELGVDIGALRLDDPSCSTPTDPERCLARVARAGIFGELTPHVRTQIENGIPVVVTTASGTLRYSWLDADGIRRQRAGTVSADVPIYRFSAPNLAECGAAGPIVDSSRTIELPVNSRNYAVNIALPRDLSALRSQQNARIGVTVDSRSASVHRLRVVLDLSDGSRVTSGPIEINLFHLRARDEGKTFPAVFHAGLHPYR